MSDPQQANAATRGSASDARRRQRVDTGDTVAAAVGTHHQRLPKKRYSVSRSSACASCRSARARCSQDRPQCERCKQHQLACVYERRGVHHRPVPKSDTTTSSMHAAVNDDHRPSDFSHLASSSSTPPPLFTPSTVRTDNDPLSSRLELSTLLTAYYTHVYNVQCMSFLHRAQLFRQVEHGQVSPVVVKAICGLSARYLPGADQNHLEGGIQAALWIQEVKTALIAETNRFSTSKLAATLCVLQHELNCGRTGSAWMFVALAARMTLAMGMNIEPPQIGLPWIEREQRRRLMWATYCADSFCSSGWAEYSILAAVDLRIYLPSDETSFLLGVEQRGYFLDEVINSAEEDSPETLDFAASSNLTTRWIWLNKLRDELLTYVRRVSQHEIKPWDPHSPFIEVVRRLRRWRDTLPAALELTVDNLYARQATHELDALATLHLCFESVHSTLYRFTLPNFTESAKAEFLLGAPREWIQQVRFAANSRAVAVVRILELLEKTFPAHVPSTKLFNLYIFNSIQVQLQYRALHAGEGANANTDITSSGFKMMTHVLGKMTNCFFDNRRLLRDILKILARHGHDIDHEWGDRLGLTSGSRTPNEMASALSGLPAVPARQSGFEGHLSQLLDRAERQNRLDIGNEYRTSFISSDPISEATRPSLPLQAESLTSVSSVLSGPDPHRNLMTLSDSSHNVNLGSVDDRFDHILPGDYLNSLISESSLDGLALLSAFWESSNTLSGTLGPDTSMVGPAYSFADLTGGSWTAATSDFVWDQAEGSHHST